MKIQYLGHACFKISSNRQSLIIDPYQDESVDGLAPLRETANAVITSHQHADHYGIDCVRIVPGGQSDFAIEKIASWHDDQKGALRGANTIHVITVEGIKIAHLGDLGCSLDETQKSELRDLDILMIPVGGYFTIDAKQAAEIVRELEPRTAIPMHYRGEDFGYEVLGTIDAFVSEFSDVKNVGNVLTPDDIAAKISVMDFRA